MVILMIDSIFFFKQKTAYEMRISDWSSDVCSSDLVEPGGPAGAGLGDRAQQVVDLAKRIVVDHARDAAVAGALIQQVALAVRSEARRVGNECVETFQSRWSPFH